MSGIIVAILAGLLTPQAAPHPSTLEPYAAPAIRPHEPDSDFGREVAEGDGEAALHRRPLTAPVTVDAYARSYEYSRSDADIVYDQGVSSAEIRADQTAGPLDGMWRVRDAAGRTLFDIVLTDRGSGSVEGGWRRADGSGAALFDGRVLTLEGGGAIALEPAPAGWSGQLTGDGQTRPVTVTRPD
jgi:hypothetical protein